MNEKLNKALEKIDPDLIEEAMYAEKLEHKTARAVKTAVIIGVSAAAVVGLCMGMVNLGLKSRSVDLIDSSGANSEGLGGSSQGTSSSESGSQSLNMVNENEKEIPVVSITQKYMESWRSYGKSAGLIAANDDIVVFTDGSDGLYVYEFDTDKLLFTMDIKSTLVSVIGEDFYLYDDIQVKLGKGDADITDNLYLTVTYTGIKTANADYSLEDLAYRINTAGNMLEEMDDCPDFAESEVVCKLDGFDYFGGAGGGLIKLNDNDYVCLDIAPFYKDTNFYDLGDGRYVGNNAYQDMEKKGNMSYYPELMLISPTKYVNGKAVNYYPFSDFYSGEYESEGTGISLLFEEDINSVYVKTEDDIIEYGNYASCGNNIYIYDTTALNLAYKLEADKERLTLIEGEIGYRESSGEEFAAKQGAEFTYVKTELTGEYPKLDTSNYAYPAKVVDDLDCYTAGGGKYSEGCIINMMSGEEVYAADDGVVIYYDYLYSLGNHLAILHNDGAITAYGHLLFDPAAKAGKTVKKGDLIGYSGDTGATKDPSLWVHAYEPSKIGEMLLRYSEYYKDVLTTYFTTDNVYDIGLDMNYVKDKLQNYIESVKAVSEALGGMDTVKNRDVIYYTKLFASKLECLGRTADENKKYILDHAKSLIENLLDNLETEESRNGIDNAYLEELIPKIQAEHPLETQYGSENMGWCLKTKDYVVSMQFGYDKWGQINHYGIDITGEDIAGKEICAVQSGNVIIAGEDPAYGKYIIIDHQGGFATVYAHCSELNVVTGQPVTKGDVIGYVGCTGYATGELLHFETRVNGVAVNPMTYIYEDIPD